MENKKKVICFGEILWDVVAENRLIGGAPLNVCYHLSKCNINSQVVSQIGNDADGIDLKDSIDALGIDTTLISVSETLPTSNVFVHLIENGKVNYEICENVAWDFIKFDKKTAAEISKSNCFVYGSLITRNAVSKNTLLKYLEYSNWNILDLNLRPPYFSEESIHQLLLSCHTLKVNDNELSVIGDLFCKDNSPDKRIEDIFITFTNIREIIVTKGAEGVSFYSNKESIDIPGIKVNVIDTVGSGDSLLAAYLAGRLNDKSIEECLYDAVALSAFITSQPGACPVYNAEEVSRVKTNTNYYLQYSSFL